MFETSWRPSRLLCNDFLAGTVVDCFLMLSKFAPNSGNYSHFYREICRGRNDDLHASLVALAYTSATFPQHCAQQYTTRAWTQCACRARCRYCSCQVSSLHATAMQLDGVSQCGCCPQAGCGSQAVLQSHIETPCARAFERHEFGQQSPPPPQVLADRLSKPVTPAAPSGRPQGPQVTCCAGRREGNTGPTQ